MNDLNNYKKSLDLNLDSFERDLLKALKKIFSKTIKESFLVNMVKHVEDDPRYKAIFINTTNFNYNMTIYRSAIGKNFTYANICKMIVMTHYCNVVSLDDHERGQKQESKEYKDELVGQVIKMFAIEKFAAADFSNTSLESYLPLIYYISAVNEYCGIQYDKFNSERLDVKSPYNNDINYGMLFKLLKKIKACTVLVDVQAIDDLMVIYRSLVELFMIYSALWDQAVDVVESFYEFDKASFDFNYGNKVSEKIIKEAKELKANKVDFINYGWIRNLKEFKNIKSKNAFKLSALAKILDEKYSNITPNFGTELYNSYKSCNPQTHGTMHMMNYFQLELYIFQNIAVMLKFICERMSVNLFNFDFKIGYIDLINELNEALTKSRQIYDWMLQDTRNVDKTNKEYLDRVDCSMKMKTL